MDDDFLAIEARAVALRLTLTELVDGTEGLSRPTFWRAKTGVTGTAPRVKVLRLLEARLDQLEAGEKPMNLFAYEAPTYPLSPGFTDRDTSRKAAESMGGRVAYIRERCLEVLASGPRTADEIARAIGETVLATRPRITELFKLGRIRDTGERRANDSGRTAKVMALAEESN